MLWRPSTGSRGRPRSTPPGFIHPARPTVSAKPPKGEGWGHEVKHDGYRMQVHVRAGGRVRLYTMNAANWTERYTLVTAAAARLKSTAIIDAEVVCTDAGLAVFDTLHSRCNDHHAIAVGFDLLMLDGDDLRRRPLSERKAALKRLLSARSRVGDGLQYVEHVAGDGAEMFAAACAAGLEGIVSKRVTSPYRSGPTKSWIKVKNRAAPAYLRVSDGSF